MSHTAIIGAGMAGLAAAWKLRHRDQEVTIFEKSRGLSGRAATRRRDHSRYDHGANFFRTQDPDVHHLVHHSLPTEDLTEIPGPIWTFDANNNITPGDPERNAHPKFTYRSGISNLGKLLAAAADPTIHRQSLITGLSRESNQWLLHNEDGTTHGPFQNLILTPPAPQCATLLATIEGNDPTLAALHHTLSDCSFHQQFTFILGFNHRVQRDAPFHALATSDHQHDLAWLSFENDKPGHVDPSHSVLILQMSPAWSSTHYEVTPEKLQPLALAAARSLLPNLPTPSWWDSQRWRFAHPAQTPNPVHFQAAESLGLFLAGDTIAGRGRIPLALKSGLQTASRILDRSPSLS